MSDETGRPEVFVRPFPEVEEGRWQVSRDGGSEPQWTPDGRELLFRARSGQLMAAPVVTSPSFRVAGTRALFDASPFQAGLSHPNYAVTPDGRRLVFARLGVGPARRGRLVLVQNLFTELLPLLERE